jgi:histone deacetylase 6
VVVEVVQGCKYYSESILAAANASQHSLVFVSQAHAVWSADAGRPKPSKRYGTLIQSPKRGLSEMLLHHKGDVFEWIEERVKPNESEEEEEQAEKSSRGKQAQF